MAINFSAQVYLPAYNAFARPITVTPIVSQPNAAAYDARGIYNTVPIDILAMDGSIISDTRTILDILESEFAVLPQQHDLVSIPANAGMPALGDFEIADTDANGGGETTLTLKKIVQAKP